MVALTIIHVLGSFQIGGAEMVAFNLAASQVALGHRVHVVSLTSGQHGPHAQGFAKAGVVVQGDLERARCPGFALRAQDRPPFLVPSARTEIERNSPQVLPARGGANQPRPTSIAIQGFGLLARPEVHWRTVEEWG